MIFYDELEDVPEQFRADYIESEFDGKKGFQHKQVVALAHAYRTEKADKDKLRSALSEKDKTLSEYQAQKELELKQAQEEAYQKALKENNLERILEIEAQKAEDKAKRAREEAKAEALKEFEAAISRERRESIISQLAAKGVNAGAREAMRDSLEKHVTVCQDTNQIIFKDSSGGALSVDADGFAAEMLKMPKFSMLMEVTPPNSGAGAANGAGGAGSPAIKNPFSKESFNLTEQAKLLKTSPSEAARLKQLAGN
jgi:membrane protein involved in colicin uptake